MHPKLALRAALPLLALASPAGATVVYENTFDAGPVGAEWSRTDLGRSPSGERFLGNFGKNIVELSLSDLPIHTTLTISFDLYIIKSWDGIGPFGEDRWWMDLDRQRVFESTFSNAADIPGEGQHFPDAMNSRTVHAPRSGAMETNTLGYTFAGNASDSIYRFTFEVPHDANTATIRFRGGPELEALANESWGLDNITIAAIGEPIPAPASAALLSTALLAAARRRRA